MRRAGKASDVHIYWKYMVFMDLSLPYTVQSLQELHVVLIEIITTEVWSRHHIPCGCNRISYIFLTQMPTRSKEESKGKVS